MKKVVAGEIYLLYISVTLSTAVVFLPYLIAGESFQDSWISVLLGTAVALPFCLVGIALANRFPEKGLEEILETILGKILGKVFGVIYAILFLYVSALVIRQLEEFFLLAIMPETPALAFRVLYVLVLALGVYEGTLAILRTNVYVVPVGIVVVGLVVVLATTKMEFFNLTPVFTINLEGILRGGFLVLGWLLQFPLIILIFFKYLETAKLKPRIRLEGILSVVVVGLAMVAGAVGSIAIFGPRQTATMLYPAFSMARVISVGGFVEHVEITFVAVWVAGMYICATAYCFMAILLLASVLGIEKKYKKIALPISATLFYLPAVVARDLSSMFNALRTTFPMLMVIFGGILPTLFLILAVGLNKGVPPKELKKMQKESEKKQPPKTNFGEPEVDAAGEGKQTGENSQSQGRNGESNEGSGKDSEKQGDGDQGNKDQDKDKTDSDNEKK